MQTPYGVLSELEFSSFLKNLLPSDDIGDMVAPTKTTAKELTSEDFEDEDHVFFGMENQDIINSVWGIFYCGGSNIVASKIKQIGKETGIPVVFEKFNW